MNRQLELEFLVEVPEYEGLYEVSSLGRVRSLNYMHTWQVRELKPNKDKDGYLKVRLYKDGVSKQFLVHRLVWTAFNGAIPEGLELDHINAERYDNRLSNLRCVTSKENSNNPITKARMAKSNAVSNKKRLSKSIVQLDKTTGQVIKRWYSARDAERELGVKHANISACCLDKKKSAGGYRWCFFMPPALLSYQ